MKKVLILSYFFPPCNLPAALRAYGWARHLKAFGYHPIIITRHWDHPIESAKDSSRASGDHVLHREFDGYEVFYVPFKPGLRDKLFVRFGDKRFTWLRRMLSLLELLTQNFSNLFLPYRNIFRFTKKFLERNTDCKTLIVTANPFVLFRWGYLLKKKFEIKWIADYRDDWNTSELSQRKRLIDRLLDTIEAKSERRWVPSASVFTTVSEYYVEKIGRFLNMNGIMLPNGYSEEDFSGELPYLFTTFTILYNGSLYQSQRIEMFLDGYRNFLRAHPPDAARLLFYGLSYNKEQEMRVKWYAADIASSMIIANRAPRNEFLFTQGQSHVLLLVTHEGLKGIPSSKLYEYIGTGKPILVCPPDNDIVERTLAGYNMAIFCYTPRDVQQALEKLYVRFRENKFNDSRPDEEFRSKYSRRRQAEKLATLLDSLN